MDTNPNVPNGQNDPFGEDFFFPPHPEEVRARAQQVRQDNQDAVRHYVDLLAWGLMDRPDLAKIFVALLWLWEDIETEWLAESCYMSLHNTCEVAEAESPVTFNCLDCGVELPIIDRQHVSDRLRSYKAFHRGEIRGTPRVLLCASCTNRRDRDDKRQRELDQRRYRAMLRDYRLGSYDGRRETEEWAILKQEIHSRDGHRCRICNRQDRTLHLHHRSYRGYAEESLEDVITLCADCHNLFHAHRRVS